jgi:hypothetical protein
MQALGSYLSSRHIISARQTCKSWKEGLADALTELVLDSQNLDLLRLAFFKRIIKDVFPSAHSLTLDVGCNPAMTDDQAAQHERALVSGMAANCAEENVHTAVSELIALQAFKQFVTLCAILLPCHFPMLWPA